MRRRGYTYDEALAAYERLGYETKRVGVETHGPCPVCGDGVDRFWIAPGRRTDVVVQCRQCAQRWGSSEAHRRLVEALGLGPRRDFRRPIRRGPDWDPGPRPAAWGPPKMPEPES